MGDINKSSIGDERKSFDKMVEDGELIKFNGLYYQVDENKVSFFPETLKYKIEKEGEIEKNRANVEKIIKDKKRI